MVVALLLTGLPVVAGAADLVENVSISPVATQQQRMWCGSNYNTTDWVYEPWGYLGYGKVFYARFYNNTSLSNDDVVQYVIRFDALAKENEKTLYMAAVALSDTDAAVVETDVTSATSTRKVTSTAAGDKLMTTTAGYYKDTVKNNVIAYTRATASDTAVSGGVSYAHGTYSYPVSFELDVTDYVKTQFAAGKKNVQFVLISARQVMNGSTNVATLADFSHYKNGKVYNTAGEVLLESATLSLDTSITVAGAQDYYSVTPENDLYFSWMEIKRDTIRLDIIQDQYADLFAAFKAKVTGAAAVSQHLDDLEGLLSDELLALYDTVAAKNAVLDQAVYSSLQSCNSSSEFVTALYQTVMGHAYVRLSAVATQQQRMWCGTDYNTTDWVYEPWGYLGYGKVLYARFYNNTNQQGVNQYVIKFDALTKENEKTVYMAAVALSDSDASVVETDVTSATSTRKVTSTAAAGKLMTTSTGYYKDAVKNSVIAYTKATASGGAVGNPVSYTHGTYAYPVSFELDVTDYVKEQFAAGKKNVQFALISARQIMDGNTNVAELTDFSHYQNGKAYNTYGEVLLEKNTLSLDTSIPVAGAADYYSVTPQNDPYFSWMEIKRDTIALDQCVIDKDELFAAFKAQVSTPADLPAAVSGIRFLFTDEIYKIYQSALVVGDGINTELYNVLADCNTATAFAAAFTDTVLNKRYGGYPCAITLTDNFAGRRGSVSVQGDYPEACYLYIETYNKNTAKLQSFAFPVKDGLGYYNVYGKDSGATSLTATLTADKAGQYPLSATETVTLSTAVLPGVFITELSNMHTNAYSSDSGSSENQGSWTQCYQYIELHNYSASDVDLSQMKFVYYNGSERSFDWILEDGGSLILRAGQSYVIGVYTGYSYYTNGHTYATSAARTQYWTDFQKYYNVTIPKTNRVMIACVNSGTSAYSSTAVLQRSKEAGVTCYAEIRNGNTTVTKVMLPDSKPHRGYAYQFVPDGSGNVTEKLLFATGCFPYRMLREQDLSYCEEVPFTVQDDVKVLCYNILADETYYTVGSRIPRLMDVLQTYQPDIIGFQEFNYSWANQLPSKMPREYSVIEGISTYNHTFSNASGTWDLLNPIYFRNDKYTVLDSGAAFMTPDGNMGTQQWDSVNMKRTMTWVVLKDKVTGEIFNVVNAHLVLSGKTARVEQVKLVYNKGAELQKKYGGGIIAMGDHNMQEASEPYQAYINSGIVVDAKYETVNHNSKDTAPAVNKYDGDYGVPIDFVMVNSGKIGVREYHVFDGIYSDGPVSDHSGVLVTLYSKGDTDDEAPVISGVKEGANYCGGATFTVSDENLDQVFLNGTAITVPAGGYTVTKSGVNTLKAVDTLGRKTVVTFNTGTHEWETEYTVDTQPTCKVPGSKSFHCSVCDAINEDSVTAIPVNDDHDEDDTIHVDLAPTALAPGYGHTVCTLCGRTVTANIPIPALGVATVAGVGYPTLEEALTAAVAGDTVSLNTATEIENLIIKTGVTLDLNGYALEAEYVVGFNGSALINSAENAEGKLFVTQNQLSLCKDNPYLPVYDKANGCYLFTRLKNNRYSLTTDSVSGKPCYATSPMFKSYVHPLMDTVGEAAASGVNVIIRLTWTDSDGQYVGAQEYIYLDSSLSEVIASYVNENGSVNYNRQFYGIFVGSEIEQGVDVYVSTVVRSSTGVEMVSSTTRLFATE